jgi:hypothetical protein
MSQTGSCNHRAKLTEIQVTEIRILYERGLYYRKLASDRSTVNLAKRYGVTHSTIEKIIANQTWRHVP